MRPYPVEVASVTRAAKGNGSIKELQGEGNEQVVEEQEKEKPEDKEKVKEKAEAAYPGEKQGEQGTNSSGFDRNLGWKGDGREEGKKRKISVGIGVRMRRKSHKNYW
ncbi:hypothetical protein K435DRAFT_796612 [Dendrothele bispora CBS 962.96]|uniref:Uncharacterized protein n=1 Tax=Dendrothele bispora (strain CBS 962.96) TaxID=1314807 RepID=A0A4S8M5N8_DENBC|nr:hypothetical protein K435DRAFT_796612 [Dendrothele bispora CBS 962.96]